MLVVAGGSGAGFTLPIVEAVLRRNAALVGEEGKGRAAEVRVVVATRDAGTRAWYSAELRGLLERYPGAAAAALVASVHVTGEVAEEGEGEVVDGKEVEEGEGEEEKRGGVVVWKAGRPRLPKIVADCAASSERGTALGIAVCGPAGMLYDVRNAAAEAQWGVFKGKGAGEVFLHTEHFS